MAAAGSTASRKTAPETITVRPINGFIGAEIEGVDLRQPLNADAFKTVHDALVAYEVIVLRDQDITVDQQMAFGALFGELSIHPSRPISPTSPKSLSSTIPRTTRRP